MDGPRLGGVTAWRALLPHLRIPYHTSPWHEMAPLGLQELAVDVLRLRLGDPAWTAQLAPYWASLPAQGALFSKEAWSADHLDTLQDPGLARPRPHA